MWENWRILTISFTFWQDTKIALDGIEMLQHMTEKQLDYVFKVGVNLESIVLYM